MRQTTSLVLILGLSALGVAIAPPAQAAGPSLSIAPATWNIIGLDSNKPSVSNGRPNEFPVSAKVCNTGDAAATNVQAAWTWTTSNSNLSLAMPAVTTRSVPDLAPGECSPVTFNVLVNRNQQSFTNRTRGFQITASATGAASVSTPANRELYIEKLIRQNRNAVMGITGAACSGGTCTVYKGQTYTFTLTAKTATQGYEQLQSFVNFPDSIFEIRKIQTRYAAPPGATNDKVYADACGWNAATNSPTYRSCIGPTNYPGGKAGGNPIKVTYTVKVVGTGSGTLSGLVYDYSGSSFHYNADYSSGPNALPFTALNAADISVTKSHTGAFVRGSTGTYTLTVHNDGPSSSGTITLTDTLPAGLTYKSISGVGWSCGVCSAGSQTVTLSHAALASGQSATVDLTVDVSAQAASSVTNSASVTQSVNSSFNDPVSSNNTTTDQTTVANPAQADLVLTKTSSDNPTPGSNVSYDIRVRNDGPGTATGPLVVTDTLPAGLTFVSGGGTGWTCNASGQDVTCTRNAGLSAGEESPALTLVVAVDPNAPSRITNETSVAAAVDNDPHHPNNVDVTDTLLVGRADLWIEKTHSGSFTRGSTGSYSITVGNDGPDAADTPRVVDTLPSGLTFASASGTGWSCSNSGQTVTCNSSTDLAAGDTRPLTINVNVASGAPATVMNDAVVCSVMDPSGVNGCPDQDRGTYETDASDNSSEDLAETVLPTDLRLTKTASVASVNPNTNFTYTLQVTNNGPNAATNVTVVDHLPQHIDPTSVSTNPGPSNTSTPPYCDVVELEVTCLVGTVSATPGSNTSTITITAKALSSGSGRTLVNNASVFSDLGDTNSSNDAATASVTVTGTLNNTAPSVSDRSASLPHLSNSGVDVVLAGTDADGDNLTYNLPSANGGAAHGTVTISGNVATYVPTGDFVGTDTFQYRANDGVTNSAPATVTVTLTNSAPTLESVALSPESIGTTGTLTATAVSPSDADNDDLTFTYVWTRIRGNASTVLETTSGAGPSDTYDLATAQTAFLAEDVIEVSVTASDGHGDSPARTAAIEVGNLAPSATDGEFATQEDTPVAITLGGTDPEDDVLTFKITSLPLHGELRDEPNGAVVSAAPFVLADDDVTYVPDPDFNGDDGFTFDVSDGRLESAEATAAVVVSPVNDRPSADDDSMQVAAGASDEQLDLATLADDVETSDANLTYEIVTNPAHGTATINGTVVTYTRTAPGRSADSFTYKVVDRGDPDGCGSPVPGDCTAAKDSLPAEISVTRANSAPTATPQTLSLDEDTVEATDLEGTDPEDDTLSFTITSLPEHGTLYEGEGQTATAITTTPSTIMGTRVSYEPDAGYTGTDGFDFEVSDGDADSASALVSIDVDPVNDAPTANDDEISVANDAQATITFEGNDIDGDDLSFTVAGGPLHGTLGNPGPPSCNAGTCTATATYTPDPGYVGADAITYVAGDGTVDSAPATVTIDVTEAGAQCGDPIEAETRGDPIRGTPCGEEILVHATQDGTVSALGGNDTVTIDGTATIRISAGRGDDKVFCADGVTTVKGGRGDDLIRCGSANDIIGGGRGNDVINAGIGDDDALGGDGNDYLRMGAGVDHGDGEEGTDRLSGGAGLDHLNGRDGDDILVGGRGNDRMRGAGDNDVLRGGLGRDFATGSLGTDVVFGQQNADRVQGGSGDDLVVGGMGDDYLKGRDGDDVLKAGLGDDTLRGLLGEDLLKAGPGHNLLRGGKDVDTCVAAATGNLWSGCEVRKLFPL